MLTLVTALTFCQSGLSKLFFLVLTSYIAKCLLIEYVLGSPTSTLWGFSARLTAVVSSSFLPFNSCFVINSAWILHHVNKLHYFWNTLSSFLLKHFLLDTNLGSSLLFVLLIPFLWFFFLLSVFFSCLCALDRWSRA